MRFRMGKLEREALVSFVIENENAEKKTTTTKGYADKHNAQKQNEYEWNFTACPTTRCPANNL